MRTWRERDPLSALAAMATSGMDGAFYACLRLCWLECAVALGICIIARVVILGDGILFLAKQTVRVPSRQRRDAHGAADRHLGKPSRGEPDDGGERRRDNEAVGRGDDDGACADQPATSRRLAVWSSYEYSYEVHGL